MRGFTIRTIRARVESLDRQLNPYDGPDVEELILQTAGLPLQDKRGRRTGRRRTLGEIVAASWEPERHQATLRPLDVAISENDASVRAEDSSEPDPKM
jgi:hypothetical protein